MVTWADFFTALRNPVHQSLHALNRDPPPETLGRGGHRLTGAVDCVSGSRQLKLDAVAVSGANTTISGTLGGTPLRATFKSDPPDPGTSGWLP